jgi:prepilin peptidase CpaA
MAFDILLVTILIICFTTDLKEQKIYNKVIFPGFMGAFALNLIYYGTSGIKVFFVGFAAGFVILIIPYLLGGIGAGDVKLLALIGAIKGSSFALNSALYMAVIGGAIALGVILFHKQSVKFFKEFFRWIFYSLHGVKYKLETESSPFLKKYPYGIAIVGGALICLIFKGAWLI